ncbi:MAG: DHHA1 domain-containing protein [Candidatus Aenigmatarchaeota archaeon]
MKPEEFLKNIKEKDNVVIIFNNDGDGICSCALLMKVLHPNKPFIISQPMPMDKNLIQRIQTTLPNKIIFLDLAVDQQQGILKKIGNIADIMIIDHHKFLKNLTSSHVIHVNPRFEKHDIYQSTSYLVYKICSKICNMEDHLWIAAIGIIADYDIRYSDDVMEKIKKKYSLSGSAYDSAFGKIANMISSANAIKDITSEEITEIVVKAKYPEDVMGNDKLIIAHDKIEKEIESAMEDFDKNCEKHKGILFYNIKSKYNIASPVVMRAMKSSAGIVIVYKKNGSKIKVSARSAKLDIAKIMKKAAEGLQASAGGHERAAGALVSANDWETFKKRIVEIVNK